MFWWRSLYLIQIICSDELLAKILCLRPMCWLDQRTLTRGQLSRERRLKIESFRAIRWRHPIIRMETEKRGKERCRHNRAPVRHRQNITPRLSRSWLVGDGHVTSRRCRRPFWYRSKTFDFLFQLFSQLSSKLSSGCSSNNSSEVKKWVKHLLDFFESFSVFAKNTVQPSNILLSQWVVLLFVRFFFYFDPTILTVWKKCHACIRKDETAVQQKMESFERSVSSIFLPTEIWNRSISGSRFISNGIGTLNFRSGSFNTRLCRSHSVYRYWQIKIG